MPFRHPSRAGPPNSWHGDTPPQKRLPLPFAKDLLGCPTSLLSLYLVAGLLQLVLPGRLLLLQLSLNVDVDLPAMGPWLPRASASSVALRTSSGVIPFTSPLASLHSRVASEGL